jgi:hypothetical protein
MKVNEEVKKEETNRAQEVLTDLPVADDQASKTTGGTDTFSVNFQAIKFAYKPQKPDGSLD